MLRTFMRPAVAPHTTLGGSMMIAIWFVAGCLAVAVPFYLYHDPFDLWPSIYAAGFGGTVYLFALLYYLYKTKITMKMKLLVGSLVGIFLVASAVSWGTLDAMSRYQQKLLAKIRVVIGEGILVGEDVTVRGIPVYAAYHRQQGKKKGIGTLFREIHKKHIRQNMSGEEMFVDDLSMNGANKTYVNFYGDTSVVLVSIDTVALGREKLFVNANGDTGRLQTITNISARGVDYERNN